MSVHHEEEVAESLHIEHFEYENEHSHLDKDMSHLPASHAPRSLSWWRIAGIAFVFTCCGPGGLEEVVSSGGPLWGFIGIFTVPIFYVIPQILVVAEVGGMMPSAAGSVLWVYRAFGEFPGFYNAWIASVTNMIDAATYPVLFGDYVARTYHGGGVSYELKVLYRLAALIVGTILCLMSAKKVSTLSTLGSGVIIAIVVACFVRVLPDVNTSQWETERVTTDYGVLLASLLWLYTGWAALGSLAGETKRSNSMVIGLSTALLVDVFVYFAAIVAGVHVAKSRKEWDAGYWAIAYDRIIPGLGPVMGSIMACTFIGQFVSAVICYSRSFWGMAHMAWTPRCFRNMLSNGVPHYSVILHVLVAFTLIFFDFDFVVQLEYTAAAASYILVFFSFLGLRYKFPNARRRFKVKGGMWFPWLITLSKTVIMCTTLYCGIIKPSICIALVLTNVFTIVAYIVYRRVHENPSALRDQFKHVDEAVKFEDDVWTCGQEHMRELDVLEDDNKSDKEEQKILSDSGDVRGSYGTA